MLQARTAFKLIFDQIQGVDSGLDFGILWAMFPMVILYHSANRCWLAFENPREVITTRRIDEIVPALSRIQAQVDREGLWAAGFLSYEAAAAFDHNLPTHTESGFPKLWFGIFGEPRVCDPFDNDDGAFVHPLDWKPSIGRSNYESAITRIKELIARGDTYQVNYTMRLRAEIESGFEAAEFFRGLARGQGASYAAFLDIGEFAICSASPELFFRLNGNRIDVRPMKGTARRGRTTKEDSELANWLSRSTKNRAENVMIVDMMRNDLGKIANIGSVKVPALFELERYPTVWQMISEVTATTDATLGEIFEALFPAASVTGAPKRRTMEIILDLEPEPRRIYTGSIGFLAPHRRAQFNVAIRTVLIDKKRNVAEYGVGGGIVWDSDTAEEYGECLVKAQVLARRPRAFSLLETMLWTLGDGYYLLEYHLKRLGDSAEYFGFSVDLLKVRDRLKELAMVLVGRERVRLLADHRGQIMLEHDGIPEAASTAPIRLRIATQPINSRDVFLYHKTTNRTVYDNARNSAPFDCDDVVLVNETGYVTETSIDNIVIEKPSGVLVTPPVGSGLLAGTLRAFLLEQGTIAEESIRIDDLKTAAKIAVINSVRGWRDAVLITD